jgi:hypothetical protein
MSYLFSGWAIVVAIGAVVYAVIHGFGFRLAGQGARPSFLKRVGIQVLLIPVIVILSYLLQFMPVGVLRVFDPLLEMIPFGAMSKAGLTSAQAGRAGLVVMGAIGLVISILFLSISLMGVTRVVAREISLSRAFLAGLWTYLILPGVPAIIGLAVAVSRIPG